MQFGIFGSAQASTQDLGPETGQGFRDYLDYAVEAEALGYRSSFLVEHHFTGWNQVSATLMLQTALAMRTTTLAARHRRHRTALAQSGAAGRAGGHPRSHFRRPARFRHRQGLPAQRVRGLPHPAGGGRAALRGVGRGDDQGVRVAPAFLPSREILAVRRHRGRAAAVATAASAVLGRGRQRRLDPPRRQARLQPDPRPVCLAAAAGAAHRALPRRADCQRLARAGRGSRSPVRLTSPTIAPTPRRRWKSRRRGTGEPSRYRARRTARPARTSCAYAATPEGTEANALYGTPDEICAKLEALQAAGVEYLILTILGGLQQLRRFAREVMPAFSLARLGRPTVSAKHA